MSDLFDNDRIRTLATEADDAQRLLERIAQAGADPTDVRETLDGIWRDLGRAVHDLWVAQRPPAPVPQPARRAPTPGADDFVATPGPEDDDLGLADFTDVPEPTSPPDDGEELERWYTDEVEIDPSGAPLFAPGEIPKGSVPEAEPIADLRGDDDLRQSEPVGFLGLDPIDPDDPPPWLDSLHELLQLLAPRDEAQTDDGADPVAVEASRVQWATTNMEIRWAEFPGPIQTALVGLLAARARDLQERLEVDVGPRLALDRLRRYRKAAGLAPVVGLIPERGPEAGTWADDARRWFSALSEGMKVPQQ